MAARGDLHWVGQDSEGQGYRRLKTTKKVQQYRQTSLPNAISSSMLSHLHRFAAQQTAHHMDVAVTAQPAQLHLVRNNKQVDRGFDACVLS